MDSQERRSSVRRASAVQFALDTGQGVQRRLSRTISGVADAQRRLSKSLSNAAVAVANTVAPAMGESDLEDHPDFLKKNPTWEAPLPPVRPVTEDALISEDISKAAPPRSAEVLEVLKEIAAPEAPLPPAKDNWSKAYLAVKRHIIMRKKITSSAMGPGARLDGYALGIWSFHSPARIRLFLLLYNQKTEYFVLALIVSHLLVLIFKGTAQEQWTHEKQFDLELADAALTLFYTVELLLRIACLGFVMGPHSFLRNAYNRLDFLIVIDSWVHIFVRSATGSDTFARVAVFRAFRGLLALQNISFFSDVIDIMAAVRKSVWPLRNVILLTLFLCSYYAQIAIQFLDGSLNKRCIRTTDNQRAYPWRWCDMKDPTHYYGYQCIAEQNQKCLMFLNTNWGATTFDDYPHALLTMFQVITLEGWSLIKNRVSDSKSRAADAYFISLCMFGTYFLINVFIAGISGTFLRVRQEHRILLKSKRETEVSFAKATVMVNAVKDVLIKETEEGSWNQRLLQKYSQIYRNASKAVSMGASKAMKHGQSSLHALATSFKSKTPQPSNKLSRKFTKSFHYGASVLKTSRLKARYLVESRLFDYLVNLSVVANLVALSLFSEYMSNALLYTLYGVEALMLILFSVEMVIRFLAAGLTDFLADGINLWDIVLILVSMGSLMTRLYPNVSGGRVLRLFYPSKKKATNSPSVVVHCLSSVHALASVYFFFVLVIMVFSIISMELWSGSYDNYPEGYPRSNHDGMLTTMLLWFSVATAESWPNQMWWSMRPGIPNKWIAPYVYVFYFCLASYVVLNLLTAVILEKNELTDREKKLMQKVEHLKELKRLETRFVTRKGSWVVRAIEGAHSGLTSMKKGLVSVKNTKSMAQRYITMKVSRITPKKEEPSSKQSEQEQVDLIQPTGTKESIGIPAGTCEIAAGSNHILSGSKEIPAESSGLLPGSSEIPGAVAPQAITKKVKLPDLVDAEPKSLNEENPSPLEEPPPTRPGRRASQVLQTAGFSPKLVTSQRRASKTVLEKAVLALAEERKQKSFHTRSLSHQEQRARPSFQLEEFDEFEKSLSIKEVPWYLSGRVMFLFPEHSYFQTFCYDVVHSKWWSYFSLIWIGISIFTYSARGPNGQPSFAPTAIQSLDIVVAIVFGIDVILKLIGHGVILTRDPYFGDPYNFIDVFILVLDVLTLFESGESTRRLLRSLLSFRPMRLICRFEGLRSLFGTILATMPAVGNLLIFTFCVFWVFATIGVQLFRGLQYSCNDGSVQDQAHCVGRYINDISLLVPRVWQPPTFHFDDIGNALLSLFVCSTFDNWLDNWMFPVMDITGADSQPSRNASPMNGIFFVVFICIGGFFIIKVFVGVFISEFGVQSGSKLLTERQKLWRDTNRVIQHLRPFLRSQPPKGFLRKWCHYIVDHHIYHKVMIVVLFSHYVFLATHRVGSNSAKREKVHALFICIYVTELLLKLLGSEVHVFIKDYPTLLESLLTIMAAVTMFPEKKSSRADIEHFAVATRTFCLIFHIPQAVVLLKTLIICLPQLWDIMVLLIILLFIFSGIGVQMFAHLKQGTCINHYVNFKDFLFSFSTIVQITTADNWSCIMADAMVTPPNCVNGPTFETNDCGFPIGSPFYFVSLLVLTTHIFMNIFVAIILDVITFGLVDEDAMITPSHLYKFQEVWAAKEFDPRSTGYIGLHKLRLFVRSLGAPLGLRRRSPIEWYTRIQYEVYGFHIPNKGIPFKPLLETLALYKIGPTGLPLPLRIERERQIAKIYREGAAIRIQALAKGFLVRKVVSSSLASRGESTQNDENSRIRRMMLE